MAKTTAKPVCTDEEFFRAWEEADTLDEVATTLKGTPKGVALKAVYYRKQGIPLKDFPKKTTYNKRIFDVDSALKTFASITGKKLAKVKSEGEAVKAAVLKKAEENKAAVLKKAEENKAKVKTE